MAVGYVRWGHKLHTLLQEPYRLFLGLLIYRVVAAQAVVSVAGWVHVLSPLIELPNPMPLAISNRYNRAVFTR